MVTFALMCCWILTLTSIWVLKASMFYFFDGRLLLSRGKLNGNSIWLWAWWAVISNVTSPRSSVLLTLSVCHWTGYYCLQGSSSPAQYTCPAGSEVFYRAFVQYIFYLLDIYIHTHSLTPIVCYFLGIFARLLLPHSYLQSLSKYLPSGELLHRRLSHIHDLSCFVLVQCWNELLLASAYKQALTAADQPTLRSSQWPSHLSAVCTSDRLTVKETLTPTQWLAYEAAFIAT